MPLVIGHIKYDTQVLYEIEAAVSLEGRNYPITISEKSDINEALHSARLFQEAGFLKGISRTIIFRRKDGYLSEEQPIKESLDIAKLEEIIESGEILPVRKYPIFAPISPLSADIGD